MASRSALYSSLGTALGAGLGFIIPGVGHAVGMGLGSTLGGLLGTILGGGPQQMDLTPFWSEYNALHKRAEEFLDPKSKFYTTARKAQRKTLFDLYMAGVRNSTRNMAARGINSFAIQENLQKDASVKATEGANKFGESLYQAGMQTAAQYENMAANVLGNIGRYEVQNVDTENAFVNQILSMGASMLGQALGNLEQSSDKVAEPKADTTPAATKPISTAPVEQPTINFSTP